MKIKIFTSILLVFLLTLLSCRNSKEKPDNTKPTVQAKKTNYTIADSAFVADSLTKKIKNKDSDVCVFLNDYFSQLSIDEQYQFLQKYGYLICQNKIFDQCIIENHQVDLVVFNAMIKDFWGQNKVLSQPIKVKDLLLKIGDECYGNYLEFSYDDKKSNGSVSFNKGKYSTTNPLKSYYSAPLIRALINEKKMSETDEFVFIKALNKNKKVVVVFNLLIKGKKDSFNGNIIDNPTLHLY